MNKANIFLTSALIIATFGCGGRGDSQDIGVMTLSGMFSGEVTIYIGGEGAATIDWGDGSPVVTYELKPHETNHETWDAYAIGWTYYGNAMRTIVIAAENVTFLSTFFVELSQLDVSKNAALTWLDCSHSQLPALDVSQNAALEFLYCSNNRLTTLDVSQNPALIVLNCSDNRLTTLDVSRNVELKLLICSDNQLNSLDVSLHPALTYLHCRNNRITSLNIHRITALSHLNVAFNNFTDYALNDLFVSLHSNDTYFTDDAGNRHYTDKTIYIEVNPGSAHCDPSIAETRGWTVRGFEGGEGVNTVRFTLIDGILTISGNGDMEKMQGAIIEDNGHDEIVVYPWNERHDEITGIIIENGVTTIGQHAFSSGFPTLSSVTIPASVKIIGWNAFFGCMALTSVDIPNGVEIISVGAFYTTGLTSVTIPASVIEIGQGEYTWGINAFGGCENLTAINVATGNENLASIDGVLFSGDRTYLMQYPGGKAGASYVVPNSVTSIGNYAFSGNAHLTSVVIPDGVTEIGSMSFAGCSALTSVTIGNGVTYMGLGVFLECNALTTVVIGANIDTGDAPFTEAYERENKAAGMYVLSNGNWIKQ